MLFLFCCCSTKSRVRGHLRLYLGYFTPDDGSETPTADSPTPPSLEVWYGVRMLNNLILFVFREIAIGDAPVIG